MKEKIIVIGGGAGGLELTARLARKLRRDKSVEVLLIDRNPTHIWKPLFHEVATGSMNSYHDEASYLMLAKKHKFSFLLGEVVNIDSASKTVRVAPLIGDDGVELIAERVLHFDQLIVAVGSLVNDFGIEGVRAHARQLDTRKQAERFHTHFVSQLQKTNLKSTSEALNVVIVGGGATGVELAIAAQHCAYPPR
ncbi:MAG: FAD-dependent oxidoreductase, partial [Pseudomonadota bacterium]